MADNTEKKVLISVEIIENFVTAKKNASEAKKALDDFIKSGEKNTKTQNELALAFAKANNEYKEAQAAIQRAVKAEDLFASASDNAVKSMGDMKRELAALRNVPLDNLNPEQINEVELRMAKLTDEIEDYKTKIKGLDTTKTFANIAESAQMAVSSVQLVSQAIGINSEDTKKFEEASVQMIGAVQALGVISEYLADKKYKLVAANFAEINSKLKISQYFKIN